MNAANDLQNAPPSFVEPDGRRKVFVDFKTASYHIVFDVTARTAHAYSEIQFVSMEDGHPIFDLLPEPSRVIIDGAPTTAPRVESPDGITVFRHLDEEIPAGEHLMTIESEVPTEARWSGEGVRWYRSPRRVSCMFSMVDLNLADTLPEPGSFLERYLPSNLEFDHFAIEMDVQVTGSDEQHCFFTNLTPTATGWNAWHVALPEYYTTSCPWFHLIAERDIRLTEDEFRSSDGRDIPVTVYTHYKGDWRDRLDRFYQGTSDLLGALESRYGAFPHPQVTIFGVTHREETGMEYAGATWTTYGALEHELNHSYFARCITPSGGDSGWIDEAIATWGDYHHFSMNVPPSPDYQLANRSPYHRTTHSYSYEHGADFIAYLDHRCQHVGGMFGILNRYLDLKRYKSVTSRDFQALVEDTAGESFEREFATFIYSRSERRIFGRMKDIMAGRGFPRGRSTAPTRGRRTNFHGVSNRSMASELFLDDD